MDPALYKAAMEGNLGVLTNLSQFDIQLTPNKSTALHVAAKFGRTLCVKEILRNHPLLLGQVNIKGETPLHIAAKGGHHDVVQALIEWARTLDGDLENGVVADKEMLRLANEDGDTALHMAVRRGNLEVVKMLIEEDREFPHPYNKAEETPLYLAAEKGQYDSVSVILETCTSPSPGGPGGRTAFHAAVVSNCERCMADVLKWKESLSKVGDVNGWTPLHYAAYLNRTERVSQLLRFDRSLAYLTADEDDKKNTPFHIAATQGNVFVMDILLSNCPDCFEMVNSRGQNVLHIAVQYKKVEVIEFILKHPSCDSLINQADNNGNTSLHLLPIVECYLPKLITHPRADWMVFNKDGKTPLDICDAKYTEYERIKLKRMTRDFENFGAKGWRNMCVENFEANEKVHTAREDIRVEGIKKKFETRLIVATLIATVTFAAGFTFPGGYNGNEGPNQGMAVLARKAAFKVFVLSDTIAMMCSTYSVYLYFISTSVKHHKELRRYNKQARRNILYAQAAMMTAFTTGVYTVFPLSSGIPIIVCVLGCLFVLVFLYELKLKNRYLIAKKLW